MDEGQTVQDDDDGYIEEEMAPREHSEIGLSYSDSETNLYCCLFGKLGFRLDMLGDTNR